MAKLTLDQRIKKVSENIQKEETNIENSKVKNSFMKPGELLIKIKIS